MTAWVHFAVCNQGSRPYQEDHYGVLELPRQLDAGDLLLVLADGMGGEQAGDRASAVAVRSFIDAYAAAACTSIAERLQAALQCANQKLALEVAADSEALAGMGCTLLAVVVAERRLHWISVGDSPLWLWRKGVLQRLNEDHSYRQVLAHQVAAGQISPFEANYHPNRNALISALTGEPLTQVDLRSDPYRLEPADWIVLASDGLLTLTEAQLAAQLKTCSGAKPACQRLLEAVLAAGHPYQDNVTVLVVQEAQRQLFRRMLRALVAMALIVLGAGGLWWGAQNSLGEQQERSGTALAEQRLLEKRS